MSATEYQRKSLVRADHLGVLHASWADQERAADRERDRGSPGGAAGAVARPAPPAGLWLYRTLWAAELASGWTPARCTQQRSGRTLDGARDVASVMDARMRAMADAACPAAAEPVDGADAAVH